MHVCGFWPSIACSVLFGPSSGDLSMGQNPPVGAFPAPVVNGMHFRKEPYSWRSWCCFFHPLLPPHLPSWARFPFIPAERPSRVVGQRHPCFHKGIPDIWGYHKHQCKHGDFKGNFNNLDTPSSLNVWCGQGLENLFSVTLVKACIHYFLKVRLKPSEVFFILATMLITPLTLNI